jgi:hypothetical protein
MVQVGDTQPEANQDDGDEEEAVDEGAVQCFSYDVLAFRPMNFRAINGSISLINRVEQCYNPCSLL